MEPRCLPHRPSGSATVSLFLFVYHHRCQPDCENAKMKPPLSRCSPWPGEQGRLCAKDKMPFPRVGQRLARAHGIPAHSTLAHDATRNKNCTALCRRPWSPVLQREVADPSRREQGLWIQTDLSLNLEITT